jgi:hypothetical protein
MPKKLFREGQGQFSWPQIENSSRPLERYIVPGLYPKFQLFSFSIELIFLKTYSKNYPKK